MPRNCGVPAAARCRPRDPVSWKTNPASEKRSVIATESARFGAQGHCGKVDQALAAQMLECGGCQAHRTRHASEFDDVAVTVDRGEQHLLNPVQARVPRCKPLTRDRRLRGCGQWVTPWMKLGACARHMTRR